MTDLYCTGCDTLVREDYDDENITLYCSYCRANTPILVDNMGSLIFPELYSKLDEYKSDNPHMETFLGYSTYESPIKDLIVDHLILKGCVSQKECESYSCNLRYKYSIQAIKVYGRL